MSILLDQNLSVKIITVYPIYIFLPGKRSPFGATNTNGILTFLDRSLSIVSTVQSAISHLTVNFTQDLFPFVSVLKFIEFKLSTKKLPKKFAERISISLEKKPYKYTNIT